MFIHVIYGAYTLINSREILNVFKYLNFFKRKNIQILVYISFDTSSYIMGILD